MYEWNNIYGIYIKIVCEGEKKYMAIYMKRDYGQLLKKGGRNMRIYYSIIFI